jgi:uncharacterized protein YegP (UPF0339 family)
MTIYKLKVYRDASGLWRWRLQAQNNRVVADSAESYVSRSNCVRAATKLASADIQLTN